MECMADTGTGACAASRSRLAGVVRLPSCAAWFHRMRWPGRMALRTLAAAPGAAFISHACLACGRPRPVVRAHTVLMAFDAAQAIGVPRPGIARAAAARGRHVNFSGMEAMKTIERGYAAGRSALLACGGLLYAGAALAVGDAPGGPAVDELNLQHPVTEIARRLYNLNTLMLILCAIIFVGVFGVMFYSVFAHRKSKGHKAANFHESTTVEVLWTVVPFIIVVLMALPATKAVIAMKDTSNPDLTIKVVGYQWKWGYEYVQGPGQGISYLSTLTTPRSAVNGQTAVNDTYLQEIDRPLVVPVDKKIRIITTAADVVHSWYVPAFGVKQDAIPGFLRDTWFKAEQVGTYRGYCTELCGKEHAYMPVVVEVLSAQDYAKWVAQQRAAMGAAGVGAAGVGAAGASGAAVAAADAPPASAAPAVDAASGAAPANAASNPAAAVTPASAASNAAVAGAPGDAAASGTPASGAAAALPVEIYFATGKSALPGDAHDALATALAYAQAHPQASLAVSGFTDATGSAALNAALSKQRALAVRDALQAAGLAPGRIVLEKPRAITGGNDARAARRVEIHAAG